MSESSQGREQARLRQRRYREGKARIDFHPDRQAIAVIDLLRTNCVGGDASSIINRIILEWDEQQRKGSVTGIK